MRNRMFVCLLVAILACWNCNATTLVSSLSISGNLSSSAIINVTKVNAKIATGNAGIAGLPSSSFHEQLNVGVKCTANLVLYLQITSSHNFNLNSTNN